MEYPMVVALVTSGKRVMFPDFPGCLVHCSFRELTGNGAHVSEAQVIKNAATEYLTQWIKSRLKGGYRISKPHDYPLPTLRSHEEIWHLELPADLITALELYWLRRELGWGKELMAKVLDIQLYRYQLIETADGSPDDEEYERIVALRDWYSNCELKATAS